MNRIEPQRGATSPTLSVEPASDEPTADESGRPLQFALRDVFLLTTGVAGTTMLARLFGPGSIVLSVSLGLAWLNVRGRLLRLQVPRARVKLFYFAWAIFLASLFLPAMRGCNRSTIPGWRAAYTCAAFEVEMARKLVVEQELPDDEPMLPAIATAGWLTTLNLANLLAFFSPALLRRLNQGKGERLSAVLAVAAVAVWSVPFNASGFLIGCYAWCAGFVVLTLTFRIGAVTFLCMLIFAVCCVLIPR